MAAFCLRRLFGLLGATYSGNDRTADSALCANHSLHAPQVIGKGDSLGTTELVRS